MMRAKSKTPQIRFKGFGGEWKEQTLGKLAEIVRGASPRPIADPKWFDNTSDVGWLRIKDVSEQDGRIFHLEQRISKLGEEKTRVLTEPHLLLSIAASVGKPVINYVNTGVHDGFLIFKNPLFNQEFMFQWMKMFENKWQAYGQPGSQVNLNSDIVKNHNLLIPQEQEQIEIGDYFQHLDKLIEQKEQKYQKLRQFKTAMLSKMFPQNGAATPEIRFIGFSGEWEEKKLESLGNFQGGGTPNTSIEHYWTGHIPWISSSDITEGDVNNINLSKFINEISIQKSATKVIPKGSVLFVARVGVGKLAIACEDLCTSQDFANLILKYDDSYFIGYYFLSKNTLLDKYSQGTSIKGFTIGDLKTLTINTPSKDEQTKIGHYFQKLDTLIDLHHQELDKLRHIKKASLEKMFV